MMTTTTPVDNFPNSEPIAVPASAVLAGLVGLALLYFVLQENGALLADSWQLLHELFHDGRHAVGVPCH